MTYFDGSSVKVIPDLEQTFFPDSGYTAPAVGDPVYISADNKVSLCTAANPAFIGFVQSIAVGGNKALNVYTFGHRLTSEKYFRRDSKCRRRRNLRKRWNLKTCTNNRLSSGRNNHSKHRHRRNHSKRLSCNN